MSVFLRLDHVSIGVKDLDKAKNLFLNVLGGQELPDSGVNESEGFGFFTFNLGGKKMELVTASSTESGVGRYIDKHGEGFHHISISVADLKAAIAYFEANGIRILSPNFEKETWKHCYLHPKDTFGALMQVFEENLQTLADAGN